jgi:hypothetical protein
METRWTLALSDLTDIQRSETTCSPGMGAAQPTGTPSVPSLTLLKDRPPGVPPTGLAFDKHLIAKGVVRAVGLNHRLLAALKQSSQKLSFSRSMAYEIWGIRCSSICHNFRNGNRFQGLERKPREVAGLDG